MEHSKDIICPDCGIETVSQEQFSKHGICTRCFRRKNMAQNAGKEYVKLINLSKEEQKVILQKRQERRDERQIKTQNLKQGKETLRKKCKTAYSNNMSLHTFLMTHENLTVKEMLDEIHKNIIGCENLSEVYLRKLIERNGYKYKKNFVNNIDKYNDSKHKQPKQEDIDKRVMIASSRNKTYTQEVLDAINSLVTGAMTLKEICDVLTDMFPNNGITLSNLCTRLNRYNIPYLKSKAKGRKSTTQEDKTFTGLIKETIQTKTGPKTKLTLNTITESVNDVIEESKQTTTTHTINPDDLDEATELRLQPIKEEVETNLTNKFKELNCTLDKNYTTDDYINMLEILQYLIANVTNIIKTRTDQHDVTNAYQQDVIHEMENTLAQPGDTYLSDKMHVLRDIRRYYEYDSRDVNILKPLLETMDKKLVGHMIDLLKDQIAKRENIQFIPMVDEHLVHKYEWATDNKPDNPLKRKQILRTNTYGVYKPLYDLNMKDNKNAKKFRVSCKISGGGYGTFRNWYRDYLTANQDIALNLAQKDLKELSYKYPGMMYTGLEAHEMNR